jgi:hypothetical protein
MNMTQDGSHQPKILVAIQARERWMEKVEYGDTLPSKLLWGEFAWGSAK